MTGFFQFCRPTNILCFQNWGTISLRSKYTRKTNAPPYTFLSAQKSAQIHQSINESIKNTYLHVPWGCPKNTIFNLVHIKSRLSDQEIKEVIKKGETAPSTKYSSFLFFYINSHLSSCCFTWVKKALLLWWRWYDRLSSCCRVELCLFWNKHLRLNCVCLRESQSETEYIEKKRSEKVVGCDVREEMGGGWKVHNFSLGDPTRKNQESIGHRKIWPDVTLKQY